MSFINKRQLAKIKFSEIKKKNNIIRQDLNHSIKLPQLKCIGSNHAINSNLMLNNATSQEQQANKNYKNVSAGGHKNGLSINVNVNLNLNVCIDSN